MHRLPVLAPSSSGGSPGKSVSDNHCTLPYLSAASYCRNGTRPIAAGGRTNDGCASHQSSQEVTSMNAAVHELVICETHASTLQDLIGTLDDIAALGVNGIVPPRDVDGPSLAPLMREARARGIDVFTGLGMHQQRPGEQRDAGFMETVCAALTAPDDIRRDMESVVHALLDHQDGGFRRVLCGAAHAETWGSLAPQRAVLGSVLMLTAPGVPLLPAGQESQLEALQLHRELIALRLNRGGNSRGLTGPHIDILACNHVAKTLAYHRWCEGGTGDSVIVVINFHSTAREIDLVLPEDGVWQRVFSSDVETGQAPEFRGSRLLARMGACSAHIYTRNA